MITVKVKRGTCIQYEAECPLCGVSFRLVTITDRTDSSVGYWAADHNININGSGIDYPCSDKWDAALCGELEKMYTHGYGDTDEPYVVVSDESIECIRIGIEEAINRLYEENKCLYVMDMF